MGNFRYFGPPGEADQKMENGQLKLVGVNVRTNAIMMLLTISGLTTALSNPSSAEGFAIGFHGAGTSDLPPRGNCKTADFPRDVTDAILQVTVSLGISDLSIDFQECGRVVYLATAATGGSRANRYFVEVPPTESYPSDVQVAAIAHELYHIYQFHAHGSRSNVIDYYGSTQRVELAADFGAGLQLSSLPEIGHFYEMSVALVGDFLNDPTRSHGSPADRSRAYRSGVFFRDRVTKSLNFSRSEYYFLNFTLREVVSFGPNWE